MKASYQDFLIRDWQEGDRAAAAGVICQVLGEYGLPWEPQTTDRDAIEVEAHYLKTGGEFWVVERQGEIVGTAAYYPIQRGTKAVEIRKMYLLPSARGRGLGKFLLHQLERAISVAGFQTIWIETASVLKEAVQLYETQNYRVPVGEGTAGWVERCDRVYVKDL